MNTRTIKIQGENVKEIIKLLDGEVKSLTYQPEENTYIFFSERYYFRNNSQLMACLILNFQDESHCSIEIVTGGGSAGLAGTDLGAEGNRIKRINKDIDNICSNKGWKMYSDD
ncbi:hypothetical protein [Alkaliphilus peptidifermentans]|uniref:Uncharacterized protein n=1 Tax=Alkaliphilus peptidifermentans DSM 18978 TaxID=1120976 RepID=A0A1G5GZB4_9FIRM|nr:hypothetical protein [Alkaliphilus peptidifermentans]SCY56876.1 hypothetical protein SAMN03080606_01847 [Alkaliphilus peptidifermentans DSM 18978]